MDQTSSLASHSGSVGPNASADPLAPPPLATLTDQGLSQFLAAQTQLVSTIMQSMNQMMAQQNQVAAALVSMVDQQNQTITALMAMVNQNPQLATLPPSSSAIPALRARAKESNPEEIHSEALSIKAPCCQQDLRIKRKMLNQDQEATGSSKIHVKQPQPSRTLTSTASKPPKSAPCPPMSAPRVHLGGRPQQKKTPRAEIQCLKHREEGHFASQGPKGCQKFSADDIPEATLIATITPAAGGKNNRRIVSQLCEYRSLGLPIPQETSM